MINNSHHLFKASQRKKKIPKSSTAPWNSAKARAGNSIPITHLWFWPLLHPKLVPCSKNKVLGLKPFSILSENDAALCDKPIAYTKQTNPTMTTNKLLGSCLVFYFSQYDITIIKPVIEARTHAIRRWGMKNMIIYIPGFGGRSYFVLLHVTPYNLGAVFREPWDSNGPNGY